MAFFCSNCNAKKWTADALDHHGMCTKCRKAPVAISALRVRTAPRPLGNFAVPGDSFGKQRGIGQDLTAVPTIYVVEWGENLQVSEDPGVVLWCADPALLRNYVTYAKQIVAAANAAFSADAVHRPIWFGVETPTRQWATIGVQLAALDNYLTNTLTTIRFACSYEGGIAAIDPTKFSAASATVTVILDRGFCWRRYSAGEMICSIIHEFTHIVCRTTDEKILGKDQYGLTLCQALAVSHPDQAWVNADNLAYYICEFRGNVGGAAAAIDWAYFNTVSYAGRSTLSEGQGPL